MTWSGDKVSNTNGIPMAEAKIEKLKAEREKLVKQVEELGKKNPATFRTEAARRFHNEDLTELARKINSIDKKLGRV